MIVPLIFFILFTGLMFYLRWRSQQPKKSKEEKPVVGQTKPEKKTNYCGWATAAIVMLVSVVVAYNYFLAPKAPAYQDEAIWLTDENPTATITLQPDSWSKKLILPLERKFVIDTSNKFEGIKFWDGTEWNKETLVRYLREKDGWMGKIPHSTFRLRGQGTATITIETKADRV